MSVEAIDWTGWSILGSLAITIAFEVIRVWKGRRYDLAATILVFLAVFSCGIGVELIRAAFLGDVAQLPTAWREYLTVAGVVSFGLGFQSLSRRAQSLFSDEVGQAVGEADSSE